MNEQNVVFVTGMSGAGKSTAMGLLEDLGYHCIDNYPVQLIKALDEIIHLEPDPRYKDLAFATTAIDSPKFLSYFSNADVKIRVLFLDASDDELLLRYQFTRKAHPMILEGHAHTLEEAIEMERSMFREFVTDGMIRIDTTKIEPSGLKRLLMQFLKIDETKTFRITFTSFGYKYGIPSDADLVVDVRFLPNPFYVEELRSQTGNDEAVYRYVIEAPDTQKFLESLKPYLDTVLQEYGRQLKSHLNIAIGCTGGQHRSVSIVNWLREAYEDDYNINFFHRDIPKGDV